LYRELHRDFLDRNNATRNIEWIVNGALWAGIVLVAGQIANHVDIGNWSWYAILLAGIVLGILHFLLWMYPIQCSENADGFLAHRYRIYTHLALLDEDLKLPKEDEAREKRLQSFQESLPNREDENWYKKSFGNKGEKFGWAIVECATTTILICGVLFFLKFVEWE